MMTDLEQNRRIGDISPKQIPVKLPHYLFEVALHSAYSVALAYLALLSFHDFGWTASAFFSFWAFFKCKANLGRIHTLYRLWRGERAEYVFASIQKRETTLWFCVSMTVIAAAVTAFTLSMLHGFWHLLSFAEGSIWLLLNLGAWRGVYYAFTRDHAYNSFPEIQFATKEVLTLPIESETEELSARVPSIGVAANRRGTAGHWWTDTQLREEAKVEVRR